jgi:Rps23 Pro-64 3,4-dihydroxylase Tpa1-like proline 4-hydroxylase
VTGAAAPGPMMPYRVFRDFLSADEHRALLGWTLANRARFRPSRLAGGVLDPAHRKSLALRDPGPMGPVLEAKVAALVPDLIAELRVTPFEVSECELELVAHNDGAHFALHTDTYATSPRARGDRMLSLVYYFHRDPKGFAGGALRLHRLGARAGDSGGADIAPEQNSLVVFPAWGPHEVMPVACPSGAFEDSRFAVNCWLYRAR